jgi:hypothetical protein
MMRSPAETAAASVGGALTGVVTGSVHPTANAAQMIATRPRAARSAPGGAIEETSQWLAGAARLVRRSGAQPLLVAASLAAGTVPAAAQVQFGGQATALVTRADPVPGDSSLIEPRLVAPVLFASAEAFGGRLRLHAMIDGEGWTMRNGQLALGAWGEGFYDRRHPHTWAHELIASWTTARVSGLQWSVSGGKGFAPYGSDDPMSRPVLMYPVNHHWAQVLERAVLIAGARRGPVTLEGGLFNGDEPERFSEWPKWSRFGDSWSARALIHPAPTLELQASFAHVKSPEDRAGAGPLNQKVSVSARLERPLGPGTLYGLAEFTSNSESSGFIVFHSELVEAEFRHGGHRHYFRVERADRPEDQRVFGDPYRSPRPPNDNSLIGITRWVTTTAGSAFGLPRPVDAVRTELIVELAWAHVTSVQGVFDPATFYGRNDLWMVSVGIRVSAGMAMHRMGRYGVAAGHDAAGTMAPMPGMPGMPGQ